jgi:hypothetical protein
MASPLRSLLCVTLLTGCASATDAEPPAEAAAASANDPFANLRPRTEAHDFGFTAVPSPAVRLPGEFEPVKTLIVSYSSEIGAPTSKLAIFYQLGDTGARIVSFPPPRRVAWMKVEITDHGGRAR